MKFFQKDNIKETIFISAIAILVMIAIMAFLSYTQYRNYCVSLNDQIAKVVGQMITDHPEWEDEIIRSLKEEDGSEKEQVGKNLLAQYGYEEQEKVYEEELQQELVSNLILNLFVVAILGCLLLVIFCVYIVVKDKKIEEMTEYVKRIQQHDYTLNLQDNTEGELSALRNELYKVTVMLKEQTELLQKDKKQLENALSDISHQLKTPLTSISVMIDILKDNPNVPEEKRQEFLYEVTRQLEWINWLVISLLKLSKLDAGTIQFKKEKVKVKELVEEVVKNLSIPIDIKNQQVTIAGKEDVAFMGDYHWTQEAVINIVKNCLEHTPEGKKVDISFAENPLYTEIQIKDEGSGIAKEDLPHIFERFYKGKNASKDSVGIGLALAQGIIKAQGGDITAYSKEGEGSEFSIKLYKGVI